MWKQRRKEKDPLYSTQRCTKLSLALHLANLTNTILPIPAYKQKLSYRTVLLSQTGMFRDSSDGIEEYTTSVTGFINKCIDDVVPTVTVRTYPNQKPWITGNIHAELTG